MTDLETKVDLNKLAINNLDSEYEPELFPGLRLKMKIPKVTFLIFSSGKIVVTGCRSLKDLKEAYAKVEAIVKKYRMK